nr:calmodulin-4-like [Microcebus murinus]
MKGLKSLKSEETVQLNTLMKELGAVLDNRRIYKNRLMDGVKTYRGGKINVNKIGDVLEILGFPLNEEEIEELCKHLPVNAAGKLYKHKLLDGIKSLRGVKLSVSKLEFFMETMGFELEEEEYQDLINNLPIDDEGKVEVDVVMNEGNLSTGEKIDTSNLKNFLENMGISLTEEKGMQLLNLPIDGEH